MTLQDPDNDPVVIQEKQMCQQIQEWTVKGQAMMVAATRSSIQKTLTMDEQYGVSVSNHFKMKNKNHNRRSDGKRIKRTMWKNDTDYVQYREEE